MGAKHIPETISLKQLGDARQELLAMVDSIDATIAAMKKLKTNEIYMFYRASLDGVNGGLVRLSSFINGLDYAKRRLVAGTPIVEGERKSRSVAPDPPSVKEKQKAEDDSIFSAFEQMLKEMRPEVAKRLADRLAGAGEAKSKRKSNDK